MFQSRVGAASMRAHRVQRVIKWRYRGCTTPPLLCPFLLGAHGSILIHLTDPGAMRTSGDSAQAIRPGGSRSEEHTSELQSRGHLVCRLLLEKKKKTNNT